MNIYKDNSCLMTRVSSETCVNTRLSLISDWVSGIIRIFKILDELIRIDFIIDL